ncbi:MAG: hypothetical protein LLF94_09825 [Chlamydiales bacterium]|nr:hypothetical protein [Chlamydiales bacterium]
MPNNGAGRSQAVANGFVEFANFWEQPPGLDGDMGQRASLVKGKHGKINDTMSPSSPPVIWNLGDQYVSAMNLDSGAIEWESLLSPGFTATAASRGAGASCTPGLVIAQAADNKLRLFDSATGEIVNAFDSEAGNSWAGAADNEIYVWIGRATGGTPTQYFKVFSLPEKITKKHKKKDCCKKKCANLNKMIRK